ncbi:MULTISPECIES: hypothetical protein [unclassified Fusibacter]|uniref:DUF7010 family protein n=1 Tax=unclassified Fusibacter TaxID=2624464 RepID=UPI0010134405|nr:MULTISPECIES: hypothetical protein [unclassified Fusibacter]MCK8058930.1 hypothetical protein [Fusibacter sp. A2]NPE22006.1 hypothetical protein [Fusibacter sp. A1]RXV61571.1 hypothetical protein DWB64_09185 [Fusibacter sp. A1]
MKLETLRLQCMKSQKKGIHFILTSVIIWSVIAVIHSTGLVIETKNLLTFCATSLLLPVSFLISKLMNIKFSSKDNPIDQLGFLVSMNQMLYLLIAMWVYATSPDKFVMVMAMIFGAHLLPYSWIYKSTSYKVFAIIIPLMALIVGSFYTSVTVAVLMIAVEVVFSVLLLQEVKKLAKA